jgi:hypothetical protein
MSDIVMLLSRTKIYYYFYLGSEFESWWGQEFSHLNIAQTGSGVHQTSYPMGTGGKVARA